MSPPGDEAAAESAEIRQISTGTGIAQLS